MRIHAHLNHLGRRHFLGVIGVVERRIAFEYAPSFLEIGIPVSPYMLPPGRGLNFDDKCVFKGLFGLFADSLPDAWGAILLRHVLEREGLPPALTQLDHLGSLAASDGVLSNMKRCADTRRPGTLPGAHPRAGTSPACRASRRLPAVSPSAAWPRDEGGCPI